MNSRAILFYFSTVIRLHRFEKIRKASNRPGKDKPRASVKDRCIHIGGYIIDRIKLDLYGIPSYHKHQL